MASATAANVTSVHTRSIVFIVTTFYNVDANRASLVKFFLHRLVNLFCDDLLNWVNFEKWARHYYPYELGLWRGTTKLIN